MARDDHAALSKRGSVFKVDSKTHGALPGAMSSGVAAADGLSAAARAEHHLVSQQEITDAYVQRIGGHPAPAKAGAPSQYPQPTPSA